jgi:squalene-hopene/tetraprenyl-beta-curcumene cyclase
LNRAISLSSVDQFGLASSNHLSFEYRNSAMPVPVEITPAQLEKTIFASQEHLLSIQHPDGYWWADLESNVTMTAEFVLLHKIWGTDASRPMEKAKTFIQSQQREHGGWELYFGDGGDLSTSIEAYAALKLLGVAATEPFLEN